MPLVGGKLASFIGVDVQRTLHAEEAFNDGYLAAALRWCGEQLSASPAALRPAGDATAP